MIQDVCIIIYISTIRWHLPDHCRFWGFAPTCSHDPCSDLVLCLLQAKELICEMCRNFYAQGWVSGTGGGISMRVADGRIVMAPSGVQKERMRPEDM